MASLRVQLGPNVVVPFGAAIVGGADAAPGESPGTGDDCARLRREEIAVAWDYGVRMKWRRHSPVFANLRSRSRASRIA
ncbi:hypothetical protein RZS28_18780 (plasmid) [Methylocapsa polymorpha]|uniref:Uncharacterized protein n=1 Tax=Methylocapsa polymorpha TaxID=3080828 RepID=A0ABZ0HY48_9HYPH|nr:hypothetical protein [Methylocapsa sp. RX1]WOJ91775.1 hypothetical protein RZS28_18780 [Methylocapsa sp. RX1]